MVVQHEVLQNANETKRYRNAVGVREVMMQVPSELEVTPHCFFKVSQLSTTDCGWVKRCTAYVNIFPYVPTMSNILMCAIHGALLSRLALLRAGTRSRLSPIGSSLASMGTATFSITISFVLSTIADLDSPELHACDASTTSVLTGAAIAGVKSITSLGLPFYSKKI